jgi:hypothetical protein
MGRRADHGSMTAILILLFIAAIGPLALRYGADSRRPSDRRSL